MMQPVFHVCKQTILQLFRNANVFVGHVRLKTDLLMYV